MHIYLDVLIMDFKLDYLLIITGPGGVCYCGSAHPVLEIKRWSHDLSLQRGWRNGPTDVHDSLYSYLGK